MVLADVCCTLTVSGAASDATHVSADGAVCFSPVVVLTRRAVRVVSGDEL